MFAPSPSHPTRAAIALAAVALLARPGSAQTIRYTVTAITSPADYSVMIPVGVSNSGVVAGNVSNSGGVRAMVWESGTSTILGPFGTHNGIGFSQANGISPTGIVAGSATIAGGSYRGFTYSGGTMTNLGTVGGANEPSEARGVSGNGLVAGWSGTRAVVGSGTFTTATVIANFNQRAVGVNDAGQVIGVNGAQGWLYSGGAALLPVLPGATFATPQAINNAGTVVGRSGVEAFTYRDGTITGLGFVPGTAGSIAHAVNSSDVAVGESGNGLAALFENGNALDLNTLIAPGSGWGLDRAFGINDNGWIVGQGSFNGQSAAFLLTPVPEPAGVLAVTTAVGLAVARVRRRR